MRMDKLTSRFQLALQDAQSLALGMDHQFIEPEHLAVAMLDQDGTSVRPLLAKAGVNINGCLLYTSPSPRDATLSRMPSSA